MDRVNYPKTALAMLAFLSTQVEAVAAQTTDETSRSDLLEIKQHVETFLTTEPKADEEAAPKADEEAAPKVDEEAAPKV